IRPIASHGRGMLRSSRGYDKRTPACGSKPAPLDYDIDCQARVGGEVPASGSLTLAENLIDFLPQDWELALDNVPDQPIIDVGIALIKDVAEPEDASMLRAARCQCLVQLPTLPQRVTDDLALPLGRRCELRITRLRC